MNRVDASIAEANQAVTNVTSRLIDGDPLRDLAWEQLGWRAAAACKKEIRRQRIELFCKRTCYVMAAVIAVVLALVWTNQLP